MKEKIKLNSSTKKSCFKFNLSNPYIKFLNINILTESAEQYESAEILEIVKTSNGGSKVTRKISKRDENSEIEDLKNIKSVDVQLLVDIEVEIEYINLKKINIDNPLEDFKNHINLSFNSRILFSAPFGEGKTTFLKFFFEESKEQYQIFNVFPVNYSVSANVDIFRYIKTDILFQLLEIIPEEQFDKIDISFSNALFNYIVTNKKEAIVGFTTSVLSLGNKSSGLSNVIKKLDSFYNKIKEIQETKSINDLKNVKTYLEGVFNIEGSIYEDDFYTQTIKQLLEITKLKTKKENILVIDDLDRLDPDHLFRILNIISAHYDIKNETNNKFGFDKIIIVADENNIKSIYNHKYGSNTSSNGYLSKFYNSSPFHYDNKKMISKQIIEINDMDVNSLDSMLKIILTMFLENGIISLRDIIQLKNIGVNKGRSEISDIKEFIYEPNFKNGIFTLIIKLLSTKFTKDELIDVVNYCKQNNSLDIAKVKFPIHDLLAALTEKSDNNSFENMYKLRDENLYFNINQSWTLNFSAITDSKAYNSNGEEYEFTINDFYDLLILNIEKYNSLSKF